MNGTSNSLPTAGDLPTTLSVEEAAQMLGIGRTLAYELIRTGSWPTPILHLGRLIKIPSGPLMTLLREGHLSNDNVA